MSVKSATAKPSQNPYAARARQIQLEHKKLRASFPRHSDYIKHIVKTSIALVRRNSTQK